VERDRSDYVNRTFADLLRPFDELENRNAPEGQHENPDDELESILERLRRQRRRLAEERCKRLIC
jgi:uncharacterized protein (UPF0305 family)